MESRGRLMAFTYERYRNPYVGSIADLLARQSDPQARAAERIADAQARAAEISGQAYAGLGQQLGQMPGQIIHEVQQLKRQGVQDDANTLRLGEEKRAVAAREAFSKIIKETPQLDEDGVSLYDIPAVGQQLATLGIDPGVAVEHLGKINDAFRQERAAKLALVKTGAASIAAAGNDPVLATHFLDTLEKNRTYPSEQIAQFRDFISADAANVAKLTAYLMGPQKMERGAPGSEAVNPLTGMPVPGSRVPETTPRPVVLAPGSTAINPTTGAPIATAPPRDPTPSPSQTHNMRLTLNGATRDVPVDYVPNKDGSGGKWMYQGEDVTGKVAAIPPASTNLTVGQTGDVKETVAGMKDGTLPPILPGRASREYVALLAEAHKQGYNLAAAATDWMATQKHIATMNGAQQLRLNQSINALPEMLDKVDELAAQWKGGRFPILNRVNLAAAKGGAYGDDVASVANRLDAQIADVVADLGNVYMGGNSPTDHALGLAGKSLAGDWSEKVLHDMVTLARGNVQIRHNSIANTGVAGASADNPYAPPPPGAPAKVTVGQILTVRGKKIRVTKIGANGQYEGVPVP